MERESLLPHWQDPATCLSPEPNKSSPVFCIPSDMLTKMVLYIGRYLKVSRAELLSC